MTPADREHLRRVLAEQLDEQAAATLMESLPPMDWQELARNDDVLANRDAIAANRDAILENRTAIEANRDAILENRTAIEGLRRDVVDLKNEVGVLRHELTASFRGELVAAVGMQSRHMIVGMVSSVVAMGGFAITLQQLG